MVGLAGVDPEGAEARQAVDLEAEATQVVEALQDRLCNLAVDRPAVDL